MGYRTLPDKVKRRKKSAEGQVLLEFTFSIFVIFLFVYAFIKVFQWTGIGLAERGQVHQKFLSRNDVVENWGNNTDGPLRQIDPYFYKPRKIRAVWGE